MGTATSQITSLTIVYLTVSSGADQRKHQSSASLAFVRGIHRWPMNSPHKWPVTREMFPFDNVIMCAQISWWAWHHGDITWRPWRFKSPATELFVQKVIRTNNEESIKHPYCWPFYGNQTASNAEAIQYHDVIKWKAATTDAIITSLFCQNDVVMSCGRNNDVIIARWGSFQQLFIQRTQHKF